MSTDSLCRLLTAELPSTVTVDGAIAEVLRPVRTRFRYTATDPFAVVLEFAVTPYNPDEPDLPSNWLFWAFSRALLDEGLHHDTGDGDVRIVPDPGLDTRVWIELSSPTGHAVLAFVRRQLEGVLAETYELVPAGTESARIDWARELAELAGDR